MRGVDGLLLAVGTFTRLPVPPPRRLDPPVPAIGIVVGPLVGGVLALVGAGVLLVGRWATGGGADPLLPALLAIAALAWMTGGLHWDGLADVADGLASRRPREQALAVLRRPDLGPLGALTLAVVLLAQVLGLAAAVSTGTGTESLVLAVTAGRVAIVVACTRGVPAARADGLGATVAGSVPRTVTVTVAALIVGLAWLLGRADADGGSVQTVAAVVLGLTAAAVVLRRSVRRLGGVTGDVLGAVCEVTTAVVLVTMAASPDWGSPDWGWLGA